MYDIERIAKIISDIEKYLEDLEELDIKEAGDLADKRNFYAISMVLLSILNRTINLGEEIVMANNLGMPSTYKGIFRLLVKNKLIDINLGEELSNLVSYRNLLSHEYYELSEKDILDVSRKINIVIKFAGRSKDLLRMDSSEC